MYELYADYGMGAMGLLLAGVTFLVGRFVLVLIDNATIGGIAQRAWKEARDAVAEVNQTYVNELKAGRSPSSEGGSRLTGSEKAKAKAMALAIVKSNLGAKGIRRLGRVLKVDLNGWLGTRIEAAVSEVKPAIAVLSDSTPS